MKIKDFQIQIYKSIIFFLSTKHLHIKQQQCYENFMFTVSDATQTHFGILSRIFRELV